MRTDEFKNYVNSPNSLISYMEHSQELWGIKDHEHRYIYMNKPLLEYINMPKGFDWEGRLDHEVPVAPCQELGEEFAKHDKETMKQNKMISQIETHYYGKGNSTVLVPTLATTTPFYDDNNKCIGIVFRCTQLDAPTLLYYMNRFNRPVLQFDMPDKNFTKREYEIIFWLQQRIPAKEIARRLDISYRTIETHVQTIYLKAGVNSVHQFIEYCKSTGLDKYIPSDFIQKGAQPLYDLVS